MKIGQSEVEIEWTPDCSGKQDFDGNVLTVSTRYWPRGGSSYVIKVEGGKVVSETDRTDPVRQARIPPSAHSTILFGNSELADQRFEAETEEEIKQQVEEWVRARLQLYYDLIITAY